MNFRFSDLKIDKVLGVDFIDKTTNQVVGHWSNLETLPEKEEEMLVEVKSDHFLPNGKNYAALVDTGFGTNWLYFGSKLTNNETEIIPFEYISEWRRAETEEMSSEFEEVRKIIKEHFNEAPCGLFFCRNITGDKITNIYDKNGIQIDICYKDEYFEVFGLDLHQQLELNIFYDILKQKHRKENTNE